MERVTWSFLLVFIGAVNCNPYYYRESKQHSEHHREYSYDGSPDHISPEAGQEPTTLQINNRPVPEKYYSALYPIQSQSAHSHDGSYSFSRGAYQQGSVYQSPLTVSSISATPVMYSQQPYGGNVVVRKVVKVFTYPSTSSQGGLVQISQSGAGSNILGSEMHGIDMNSDSLHGQRLVTKNVGSGLYTKYIPSEKMHSGQTVQIVKTEHSEYGRRGNSYGSEVGQKEVSEELSQQPLDDQLESGQKEENLELGQQEVSISLGQQSQNIELGKKEKTIQWGVPKDYSHSEQKLYHSAHSSHIELGQREEPSGLELGQREESTGIELGQKEEDLYQNPHSSNLDLGQREESLNLEVGQKEESLSQHPQSGFIELGQREEGTGIEIGQKEESLYQIPHSGNLELGQREESTGIEIGQKEESLYQSPHSGNLELGQREESTGIEIGQKEENLYQSPHSGNLELGQREESTGIEIGQKEESLYQVPHSANLELGQREESAGIEIGQKEESLYQVPHSANLELGQREENTGIEIGQKEESLYQNPIRGDLSLGQKEESSSLELGQREESLYQIPTRGDLSLGQKEESINLEIGQREESLHQYSQSGHLQTGQREDSLYGSHIGQEEEPLSAQHPEEDIGQKEETFHDHKQLELGQREVPILVPIRKQVSGSVYRREESVRHTNGPSRNFVLGQPSPVSVPPTNTPENPLAFGPVSPQPKVYHSGYSAQKEIICEHSQHHSHGGYGSGQRGHNLQLLQTGGQLSSHFQNTDEGQVDLTDDEKKNKGDKSVVFEHKYNKKVIQGPVQHEVNYYVRKVNRTTSDGHRTSSEQSNGENIESNIQTVPHGVPESFRKPYQGGGMNLNKKIEDLALELELEGIMNKPSTQNERFTTTVEGRQIHETTPRTISGEVHTAEIQELGFENVDRKTTSAVNILNVAPMGKLTSFEAQREEFGVDNPPTKKTYSKKHSRQYTRTSLTDGYIGQPAVSVERYTEYNPLQTAGQSSGSSYSYSQRGYSAHSGGSYLNDQPVQRQHISRTEFLGGTQEGNKHAVIDEFLKELDKDIARSGGRRAQTGYVQVTNQQQPSSSGSGSSYYSEKSYSSHSSHSSSSSSGSGDRSWFQKVGDSIGSTYNKAIDKIGTSYNQAKDKAKEIVDNVKHSVSYY